MNPINAQCQKALDKHLKEINKKAKQTYLRYFFIELLISVILYTIWDWSSIEEDSHLITKTFIFLFQTFIFLLMLVSICETIKDLFAFIKSTAHTWLSAPEDDLKPILPDIQFEETELTAIRQALHTRQQPFEELAKLHHATTMGLMLGEADYTTLRHQLSQASKEEKEEQEKLAKQAQEQEEKNKLIELIDENKNFIKHLLTQNSHYEVLEPFKQTLSELPKTQDLDLAQTKAQHETLLQIKEDLNSQLKQAIGINHHTH